MTATNSSRQPSASILATSRTGLEHVLQIHALSLDAMVVKARHHLGGYLLAQAGLNGRMLESLVELTRHARSHYDRRETYLKLSQTSARYLASEAKLSWDVLDDLADSFVPSLSDGAADALVRYLLTGSDLLPVLPAVPVLTTVETELHAADIPQPGEGPAAVSIRSTRSAA